MAKRTQAEKRAYRRATVGYLRGEIDRLRANLDAAHAERVRLRADLIEERRTVTRLLDDHGRACVRAEQAEDRAEQFKASERRHAEESVTLSAESAFRGAEVKRLREENERLHNEVRCLASGATLREAIAAKERAEERYKKLLQDMRDLVGESSGVYGLHSNGDPAPWDELVDLEWLPQEVLHCDD